MSRRRIDWPSVALAIVLGLWGAAVLIVGLSASY